MTPSTMAQSSALRASGPSLSSVYESAIAPCRLTRPYVGRNPVMPQCDGGQRIDPHVSAPSASAASAAATAAPHPDDEPHVQRSRFHGFFAAPVAGPDAKR